MLSYEKNIYCINKYIIFFSLTACNEADVEYFPLNEGKSWQYKITLHDMDVEKKYKQLVINEAPRQQEGADIYSRKINDEVLYFYKRTEEGVRRIGVKRKKDINTVLEEQSFYALKFPIEIGTRWQQETITGVLEVVIAPFRRHYALRTPVQMQYEIVALDEQVKVPAGRFENCIKVTGVGGRKVEAEKTSSAVLVKGDFLMELEDYSEE